MSKKGQTYSSLLSDLKDNRGGTKSSYKMHIRNSNSYTKDECIRAFNNHSLSKSKISLIDKKHDKKLNTSNIDCTNPDMTNKIDIKISVNYKPNITDKPKFYQLNRLISQTPQPQSTKNSGYLHNDQNKEPVKLTKSLIRNIKNEGRPEKKSQSELYHSNLNISFNNYENKPQVQNIYNSKLGYTPMNYKENLAQLDNLKSKYDAFALDGKLDETREIEYTKGEFTFKNDKEFLQISSLINKNIIQFNNLQSKLDKMLLDTKDEGEDAVALSNEKFLIYRRIFEEAIKLCPDPSHNVLNKLAEGYNDLIHSLLHNVNKLTHLAGESELHITSK
jgi:hypothetical protein